MISLSPKMLPRYKQILGLFLKYGRKSLRKGIDSCDPFEAGEIADIDAAQHSPNDLAHDLEKMGPVFIKLGQLLASRGDLLSEDYARALSRLRDRVKPFSYLEARAIVESELSVRISKAFSTFEKDPIS